VSTFIAQLHLIAQMDSDQWVNFLILAIMAVFWLFGTLIKAATKKRVPQTRQDGLAKEQRETWQQRLARKAEELQRAAEGRRTQAEERIRPTEERATVRERVEQPPSGNLTVRTGKGGESILVYEQADATAGSGREQQAARQREAREAVAAAGRTATMTPSEPMGERIEPQPPEQLEPSKGEVVPPGETAVGYEPDSILDYNDPDALRKAVLHYEILGKPVGLRDESERSAAF
jgi:hypothetical protein